MHHFFLIFFFFSLLIIWCLDCRKHPAPSPLLGTRATVWQRSESLTTLLSHIHLTPCHHTSALTLPPLCTPLLVPGPPWQDAALHPALVSSHTSTHPAGETHELSGFPTQHQQGPGLKVPRPDGNSHLEKTLRSARICRMLLGRNKWRRLFMALKPASALTWLQA